MCDKTQDTYASKVFLMKSVFAYGKGFLNDQAYLPSVKLKASDRVSTLRYGMVS